MDDRRCPGLWGRPGSDPMPRPDDRSVPMAIAAIAPRTTQKSPGWSNSPTLKFMPSTPAISAPGKQEERHEREGLHDLVRPVPPGA